jgi:hypothetical protein
MPHSYPVLPCVRNGIGHLWAGASPMPCGLDHGDGAGLGRLRTGKATSDRGLTASLRRRWQASTSSPGPHRPRRALPQVCFTDLTTAVASGNPSRTDSLQEIKACPRVDPRRGDLPSNERFSEESSSDSAHRNKTPSLPFTL